MAQKDDVGCLGEETSDLPETLLCITHHYLRVGKNVKQVILLPHFWSWPGQNLKETVYLETGNVKAAPTAQPVALVIEPRHCNSLTVQEVCDRVIQETVPTQIMHDKY